jgi:hypothetical protein
MDPDKQHPLKLYVRNPGLEWTSGDFIYFLEPDEHHKSWQIFIDWAEGAKPPQPGDIFEYRTKKAFKEGDVFEIRTSVSAVDNAGLDMKKIKVVPNPYLVSNLTEQASSRADRFSHELRFTNLPAKCTIKIYTLRGDLVKTIHHDSPSVGEARWYLQSNEKLEVSYGIYVYTVTTPDGKKKVDKFAIIW